MIRHYYGGKPRRAVRAENQGIGTRRAPRALRRAHAILRQLRARKAAPLFKAQIALNRIDRRNTINEETNQWICIRELRRLAFGTVIDVVVYLRHAHR